MKNKSGFTLIELLVVVLIIGILANIALPKYRIFKEKTRATSAIQALHMITDSMERYYLIHNEFPPSTGYSNCKDLSQYLDIDFNGIKYFSNCYYDGYIINANRWLSNVSTTNRYHIVKDYSHRDSPWRNKGFICWINGPDNTLAADVCRNLCGVKDLFRVTWGSELGCYIKP